jgi:polyhydroxybutyrate depolymerase
VDSEFQLFVGGEDREAVVRFDAQRREPIPMVLAFHGYGDTGAAGMERDTSFTAGADAGAYIAVYPRALGNPASWRFDATDVSFVEALMDELLGRLCVDLRRVYATGMSQGGGMANLVACRLSDRIAAVAVVAAVSGPNYGGPCDANRPVPVLGIHAAGDPTVPYSGGEVMDGTVADLPPVAPIETWAVSWAERNGCASGPEEGDVAQDLTILAWSDCEAAVVLYRLGVADHVWPGSENDPSQNLDASNVVMEFFSHQALPPAD